MMFNARRTWRLAAAVIGLAVLWAGLGKRRGGLVEEPRAAAGGKQAGALYHEAPSLRDLVAAGRLPPVEERLPHNPMLVQPVREIGRYGGTWHAGLAGATDQNLFIRTIGYEHLVRWSQQWNRVVPNVAESYLINSNATEYVFRLREGLRWSDGAPFTADDILFWYEDIFLNPELTATKPQWLVCGDKPVVVTKLGEYQVRFRFARPRGLFLEELAEPRGSVVTAFPKHYFRQYHLRYNRDAAAEALRAGFTNWGSFFISKAGDPYHVGSRWQHPDVPVLHAWVLTNTYGKADPVTAVRNPYYWKIDPAGNQLPYIDRIEFKQASNAQEVLNLALAGKIDMQDRHVGAVENLARLEEQRVAQRFHFYRTMPAFGNVMVISLNLTHRDRVLRKVFRKRSFRIGLSCAIDRHRIIERVYGGAGVPYQAAPLPQSPFYQERLAEQFLEHDLARANRELDAVGLSQRDGAGFRLRPDGRRLSIEVDVCTMQPDHVAAMELVREDWERAGLEVRLRVEERSEQTRRIALNEHDASAWLGNGGLDVILDPIYYIPYSTDSSYGVTWAHWYLKEKSPLPWEEPPPFAKQQLAWYEQLSATPDPRRQARLMVKILNLAAERFLVMGIARPENGYGVVKENFHNVPALMPLAWTYPNPAPCNPCQFYIEPAVNGKAAAARRVGEAVVELERD